MPHYWFRYETTDELAKLLADGRFAEFKQRIYEDVRARGFALDEVFFEEGGRPAYALVHAPEGVAEEAKGLAGDWDVRPAVELFTVEEMASQRGGGWPPQQAS